jgi:MYXO-CTERM domain-containing protein
MDQGYQSDMEDVSMKAVRFGRTIAVLVLLLAAVITVAPIPMAAAQTPGMPPAQSPQNSVQDTADDSFGEWGLVGLIGLLGLAGLMRRDRRTYPTDRSVDRPTERVGRP